MTARLISLLAAFAERAGWVPPVVPWREVAARTAIGMPARHPERLTAELRRREEEWLAAVAAELWPTDEYAEIIRDTNPHGGQQ